MTTQSGNAVLKRRQWIIDRSLQLRFIFVLLTVGTLNFLLYLVTLHYLLGQLRDFLAITESAAGSTAGVAFSALQRALLYKGAMAAFVVQVVLLILLGIYFSNRISGPIYRVNNSLKKILAGAAVPAIRLRRHDFMLELAENFNTLMARHDETRAAVVRELEALLASGNNMPAAHQEQLQRLLLRLKSPHPQAAEPESSSPR